MEPKRSKKSLDSIWQNSLKENECPYGCSLKDTPCSHLEDYISQSEKEAERSVKAVRVPNIDTIPIDWTQNTEGLLWVPEDYDKSTYNLVVKLQELGLADYEVTFMIERFINEATFGEIAQLHGYTSPGMAYRMYKLIIAKLKERGFSTS